MSLLSFLASPASVGDPDRTRTVYAAVLFLVALGVLLIGLTVWLVRSTRVDHEALGPLERMGERRWRRSDPVFQRRQLDEVRPIGAAPLVPTKPLPSTDDEFDRVADVFSFDDLLDLPADVEAPELPSIAEDQPVLAEPIDAGPAPDDDLVDRDPA